MAKRNVTVFDLMSDLERIVYIYLVEHSIEFTFQSQLIGGFGSQLGDAKVDCVIPDRNIVIRVQGEYWHTGVDIEAKDALQKERLSSLGYIVIDIWTQDIQNMLQETMRKALVGENMP